MTNIVQRSWQAYLRAVLSTPTLTGQRTADLLQTFIQTKPKRAAIWKNINQELSSTKLSVHPRFIAKPREWRYWLRLDFELIGRETLLQSDLSIAHSNLATLVDLEDALTILMK